MNDADPLKLLAEGEDGVFAANLKQRVVLWNAGAQRILGYSGNNVLGRPCYAVICGTSADGAMVCRSDCPEVIRARRASVPPSQTLLTRCKNGEQKWISVTHVLLPGPRPETSALVHVFHDVTDNVEARRLLQRLGSLLATPLASPPAPEERPRDGEVPYTVLQLTPRERQILRLLSQGMPTKAIATTLVISPTTVRNHTKHILAKLGAHSRVEALATVYRRPVS